MRPKVPNPVVHLELHTRDLPQARDFYAELCRWPQERVRAGRGSYLALDLASRLGGGIVECSASRSTWLPYVEVGQIGAATDRARSLGAAVLLEPSECPQGWRSVVATDTGGELAFWQPKR